MMKKLKFRGLFVAAGWMFVLWGGIVMVKGFYDLLIGEPEANYFSPRPWDFVTRSQWANWAGFEVTYGLTCVGVAYLLWKFAPRVPEYMECCSER